MPVFMGCKANRKTMSPIAAYQTGYAAQEGKTSGQLPRPAAVSSPVVYIYKMKKDYSRLVPVMMDETRIRIVSYPAPGDVKTGGKLAYPTRLEGGWWLDNRGIGPNVAFLSYTYEEYSQLEESPTMDELMAHIVDKYPLEDIRACGRRADYKDIVKELNERIAAGELK